MHARLKTAIPKLASRDIERSVAFFKKLGFTRIAVHPGMAIVTATTSRGDWGNFRFSTPTATLVTFAAPIDAVIVKQHGNRRCSQ